MIIVEINGKQYQEIDEESLPFGNACNYCAFKGTDCFNDLSFSCHSDSRSDGRGVIFEEVRP